MQTLSGAEDWYPTNYNIFEIETKNQQALYKGSLVSFNVNNLYDFIT